MPSNFQSKTSNTMSVCMFCDQWNVHSTRILHQTAHMQFVAWCTARRTRAKCACYRTSRSYLLQWNGNTPRIRSFDSNPNDTPGQMIRCIVSFPRIIIPLIRLNGVMGSVHARTHHRSACDVEISNGMPINCAKSEFFLSVLLRFVCPFRVQQIINSARKHTYTHFT